VRAAVLLGAALVFTAAPFAHDPVGTRVTWEREIAPIVQARCVTCHAAGGPAPMALTTYDEARPWARAIREEVLARRMPKWHVVRGYGDLLNDPSLSPFEIALIAAWVEGGAPRTLPSSSPPQPVPQAPATPSRPLPRVEGEVTVPCTARALPGGTVVGLRPQLERGASLRVTVTPADGIPVPLLWIRDYEPEYASTYWLRTPLQAGRGARVAMQGPPGCRLSVLLGAETAP